MQASQGTDAEDILPSPPAEDSDSSPTHYLGSM